jgi:hypothetical protein
VDRCLAGPSTYEVLEGDDVNLWEIPVPRMYPMDGGRYFGLATCFVTEDPETGWTNLGTYRAQVLDERTLGCNIWIGTKHGKHHIDKYLKRGDTKMPIAIYCGCDIFHFVVGSARVPEQTDERRHRRHDGPARGSVQKASPVQLARRVHLGGELELGKPKWRRVLVTYTAAYGAAVLGILWRSKRLSPERPFLVRPPWAAHRRHSHHQHDH